MSHVRQLATSELILQDDGSIYHLNLKPEHVAPIIITVGNPQRVSAVSDVLDSVEYRQQNREFVTHTGRLGHARVTVISSGMGAGNIDIMMNELDALFNIDLVNRSVKPDHQAFKIIRLGTCGSMNPQIEVDQLIQSVHAVGLDAVLPYYGTQFSDDPIAEALQHAMENDVQAQGLPIYYTKGSSALLKLAPPEALQGITISCPGFYAPQDRVLRFSAARKLPYERWFQMKFGSFQISNLEMETAPIYAFAKLLGHDAMSFTTVLANRSTGKFSAQPKASVRKMIESVMQAIADI